MSYPYYTKGSPFVTDNLVLGEGSSKVRTFGVKIESGQNLSKGALIGKVTSTGKYKLSLSAATDGSQVPIYILGDDADATSGDLNCLAYVSGMFNARQVTFGTGHTFESVFAQLQASGITLTQAIKGEV